MGHTLRPMREVRGNSEIGVEFFYAPLRSVHDLYTRIPMINRILATAEILHSSSSSMTEMLTGQQHLPQTSVLFSTVLQAKFRPQLARLESHSNFSDVRTQFKSPMTPYGQLGRTLSRGLFILPPSSLERPPHTVG